MVKFLFSGKKNGTLRYAVRGMSFKRPKAHGAGVRIFTLSHAPYTLRRNDIRFFIMTDTAGMSSITGVYFLEITGTIHEYQARLYCRADSKAAAPTIIRPPRIVAGDGISPRMMQARIVL